MAELLTLAEPDLPADLRWQAVSFVRVVDAAGRHLRSAGVHLGALLCDRALAGFYGPLGWTAATAPTLVEGPDDGPPTAVDALRMVLPVPGRDPAVAAAALRSPLRVRFPW